MRTAVGFFLLFLSMAVSAATIHVPADSPTIQSAIDSAGDGDKIVVWPGVYPESINFQGKNLILTSTDPINLMIVKSTIISGTAHGTAYSHTVVFSGTESNHCVLEGFTIQGDGIQGKKCQATIRNNIIAKNKRNGIFGSVNGPIYNNIVAFNESTSAGDSAVFFYCNGTIENNILYGNKMKWSNGLVIPFWHCNGEPLGVVWTANGLV